MDKQAAIFVAGHQGLVGSAILRCLQRHGFTNLLTRTRAALDLTDQAEVRAFFAQDRPSHVFLAVAKVGGIHANRTYPADFIYTGLQIKTNCYGCGPSEWRQKVVFFGQFLHLPLEAVRR